MSITKRRFFHPKRTYLCHHHQIVKRSRGVTTTSSIIIIIILLIILISCNSHLTCLLVLNPSTIILIIIMGTTTMPRVLRSSMDLWRAQQIIILPEMSSRHPMKIKCSTIPHQEENSGLPHPVGIGILKLWKIVAMNSWKQKIDKFY